MQVLVRFLARLPPCCPRVACLGNSWGLAFLHLAVPAMKLSQVSRCIWASHEDVGHAFVFVSACTLSSQRNLSAQAALRHSPAENKS